MPDPLSAAFSALADPTRRAILARLANGEATVNELAEPFEISLPAVSRHLKVLEGAGLISRGREAQWRPSRLDPVPLNAASGACASLAENGSRLCLATPTLCSLPEASLVARCARLAPATSRVHATDEPVLAPTFGGAIRCLHRRSEECVGSRRGFRKLLFYGP